MQATDSGSGLIIEVSSSDLDHMGHVNNAIYLTWVQRAVLMRWHTVAPDDVVANTLWVALKRELLYRKPAFLGDRIVIKTWAETFSAAKADFRTSICCNGQILVDLASTWVCVDAHSRRPKRINVDVANLFLSDRDSA